MKKACLVSAVISLCMLLCSCSTGQNISSATDASMSTEDPASITAPTENITEPDEGEVLHIYSLNNSLMYSVIAANPDYIDNKDETGYIGNTKVIWETPPKNADYNYSDMLRSVLERETDNADERIDIFIIEPDLSYAEEYIRSYALPLSEIGITDSDTAQMYDFTKQHGIVDGTLKAVTWTANAGVFAYRRSIAKEILGTDTPDEVQQYVTDWDKFTETAQLMKNGGYHMHITHDETFSMFYQNISAPMSSDNRITVDPSLTAWAELSKLYMDNNYITDSTMWSDGWADRMADGTVFGCFMPTWGIEYTIPSNAGESSGDWAICEGPAPYYGGGEYICVAKDTDNPETACEFIRTICCNSEVMKYLASPYYTVMPNNILSAEALAKDEAYNSEFLGGQNPYSVYNPAAKAINAENVISDDYGISFAFSAAMRYYITGQKTYDEALEEFFNSYSAQKILSEQ